MANKKIRQFGYLFLLGPLLLVGCLFNSEKEVKPIVIKSIELPTEVTQAEMKERPKQEEQAVVQPTNSDNNLEGQVIELPIPFKIQDQVVANEIIKLKIKEVPEIAFIYSGSIKDIFRKRIPQTQYLVLENCIGNRPRLSPDELKICSIKATYDNSDSSVALVAPSDWKLDYDISFDKNKPQGPTVNLNNNFISGIVNLSGSSSQSQGNLVGGQANDAARLDMSLSHDGIALQSGVSMLNGTSNRTETTFVIPNEDGSQQVWIGDLSFSAANNIQIPSLSGIGYFKGIRNLRNGTIDTGFFDFQNQTNVEVYRNEIPVLSTVFPAGRFNFKNIPLEIGQNSIKIIARDLVTGKVSSKEYSEYISPENKGKGGLEMSAIVGSERTTINTDGQIQYYGTTSYFYGLNYGLTKNLTSGLTLEKLNDLGLVAINNTYYMDNYIYRLSVGKSLSVSSTTQISAAVLRNGDLGPTRNISLDYQENNSVSTSQIVIDGRSLTQNSKQTSLKASFKPFYGISSSASATVGMGTDIGHYNIVSANLGKSFRLSKRWSLMLSGGQSVSTIDQNNQANYSATLTYSEANEDEAQKSLTLSTSNSSGTTMNTVDARWAKNKTTIDAQIRQDTGFDTTTKSISASHEFEYANLGANAMSGSDNSSSRTIFGSTAFAFTESAFAIARNIPESFVIFKRDSDKSYDFGIKNNEGGSKANSSYLGTALMPVSNFSTSDLFATFASTEQFSIENSESVVVNTKFKTGATHILHSSDEILIIVKIVGSLNEALSQLEADLICTDGVKTEKKSIFTDQEGFVNFSVGRNKQCYIESDGARTDSLELNWPVKYKEIDPVVLRAPKKEPNASK